jgi:mannose-6-phosphate isomerase-like protein (cupin superfamily)
MILIIAFAVSAAAFAHDDGLPQSKSPQATIVSAGEIKAAVERNNTGALADSVMRVVPIESGYNVGISVVRRSQIDGKTPPDAAVHDAITEVYQIIEGEGVLLTGGTLESPTTLPRDGSIVREAIGPSSIGKRIVGGERHRVGPGDMVIIPPHTPHGFVEITTNRIVYTITRIDPRRLLQLRGESH